MNRKAKEVKPRSEINSLFFFFRSWFKLLCLHFDELSCYSAVHMLLWVSLWTQPEKKKKKIKWRKTKQKPLESPARTRLQHKWVQFWAHQQYQVKSDLEPLRAPSGSTVSDSWRLSIQDRGSHTFLGVGAGRSVTPLRWVCPFYPSLWRAGGEPRYWRPSVRMVGGHPQRRGGRDTCGREEGVRSSC